MGRMLALALVGSLGAPAFVCSQAYAEDVKALEDVLMAIGDFSAAAAEEGAIPPCARMANTLAGHGSKGKTVAKASSYARSLYMKYCGSDIGNTSLYAADGSFNGLFNNLVLDFPAEVAVEEGAIESDGGAPGDAAETMDLTVWSNDPLCSDSHNLLRCRYNHETERGIVILKESRWEPYPINYLVCGQTAEKSGGSFLGIFARDYAIKSRCLVSQLGWVSYLSLDPLNDTMRSDVKGLLTWPDQAPRGEKVVMPQALADQCNSAFSDALYCTPSLIIFETEVKDVVGICSLMTERSSAGLLFIRFASAQSRWNCELRDLRHSDPEPNVLSVAERECVPDFHGEVARHCDLPYIPRSMDQRRSTNLRPRDR